jgi:hypothetical protein
MFSPKLMYIVNPVNADAMEGQELTLFLGQFGLTKQGFMSLAFVSLIVVIPLAIFVLWKIFKSQNRPLKFSILWVIVSLIPFSFFVDQFYPSFRYLIIPSIGTSILLGLLVSMALKYLKEKPKIFRYIIGFITVAWILSNVRLLYIEEQNYERYSKNIYNMVDQLRRSHLSFPVGSTLYFIGVPVENLDIRAISYVFYRGKNLKAHVVESVDKIPGEKFKADTFVFKYDNSKLELIADSRNK